MPQTPNTQSGAVLVEGKISEFRSERTSNGRKNEYALVSLATANAQRVIVTGLPANLKQGDYVKITAIPQGRRFEAWSVEKTDAPVIEATAKLEPTIITNDQRAAFAEQMRAKEALAAKMDAAVAANTTPAPVADAALPL